MRKNAGFLVLALALMVVGCGPSGGSASGGATGGATGTAKAAPISIDGSSTVGPLMEAIAEEFKKANPTADITIATSGTGGGFKKFIAGEIDVVKASRAIKKEELDELTSKNIEFVEVPIAFDGLTVVIHPQNTFAENLTVAELKKIWEPNSPVKRWNQVRPGFPDQEIKLYGAGTDSGTFDYFTEAIVGEAKASRTDYQASEDDNTLVQGVSGDPYALGYFGYSYYIANKDKIKSVALDGVKPTEVTIEDGTYKPLSRPLFLYIRKDSLEKNPMIAQMVDFLFKNGALVKETGFVPLPTEAGTLAMGRVTAKTSGSVFADAAPGMKISDILAREKGQ